MVGCNKFSAQISGQLAGKASELEGATTNIEMGLETDPSGGGSFRSTSLAKMKFWSL